ncbi:uncharacterized protein LOC144342257 [Saccoglossus kowalevskii]
MRKLKEAGNGNTPLIKYEICLVGTWILLIGYSIVLPGHLFKHGGKFQSDVVNENCPIKEEYSPITFLKPKQARCMKELFSGRDVIGVLPTGYGKSLIFELLPYVYEALELASGRSAAQCTVLVVSPLNSIINEQKQSIFTRTWLCWKRWATGIRDIVLQCLRY